MTHRRIFPSESALKFDPSLYSGFLCRKIRFPVLLNNAACETRSICSENNVHLLPEKADCLKWITISYPKQSEKAETLSISEQIFMMDILFRFPVDLPRKWF